MTSCDYCNEEQEFLHLTSSNTNICDECLEEHPQVRLVNPDAELDAYTKY